MENSEVFSFGFDYGPRVIPIEALTYWKLVPVKPEKDEEAPKKEKEQKLELKAKICCPSCIQKVKEELYYKVAGKYMFLTLFYSLNFRRKKKGSLS
jgi:hypothetical protein